MTRRPRLLGLRLLLRRICLVRAAGLGCYVPIAPAMIEDLGRFWRRHHHRQWLFPGLRCDWKKLKEPPQARARQAKTPMSESSVQGAFRPALAQSGISKPATPHTLRHSGVHPPLAGNTPAGGRCLHPLDLTPSLPLSRPFGLLLRRIRLAPAPALGCEYLGHASLDVTVIYTHLTACSEERTREALERLHAQTCRKQTGSGTHR